MKPEIPNGRKSRRSEFDLLLPARVKTIGYLISTTSVVLLAIVAWPKANESFVLFACLIGGVSTSIMGMACRWLSYEIEKHRKRDEEQ